MESRSTAALDLALDDLAPACDTRDRRFAPSRVSIDVRAAAFVCAAAALVWHAGRLGDWVVDDAGITFAYARNLALGHGLVSQPGVAPLEGFSNPLWTFVLAPFLGLGFDAVWTAKVLALLLLAATQILMLRGVTAQGAGAVLAGSATVLLALDTSLVVWGMSGLENPLLAFLLVASATLAVRGVEVGGARFDRMAGVVAGLLALTRPDAVVYVAAYPAVWALRGSEPWRERAKRLGAYGASVAGVFGSYLIFRRAYFGDWVPNTYHAKVRDWMISMDPSRLIELAQAGVGRLAAPAVALVILATLAALLRRAPVRLFILSVYLALAAGAYLALPPDWMGEYRFATGFFIFLYWGLAETLAWIWAGPRPVRWLAALFLLLVTVESATVHAARTDTFLERPTVPFARVRAFAEGYDALAAELGPGSHSLLSPDLGGLLMHSRLRIYDLAGLCDATVARTLMDDGPAFRNYVFETARPTFIHVHGTWSDWASLHADDRLARDYLVLHEAWARPRGAEVGKGEPWVGDYVRREALTSAVDIERLRAEFQRRGLHGAQP